MDIYRIWAVTLRHLLALRSSNRIFSIIYWSMLNIVIWGTTSSWIQQQAHVPNLIWTILTGLVFWQIVFRVNLETAKSLLEELNNQNLVNLFSSPLTLPEWITAIVILSIIDTLLVISCGFISIWLFYSLNLIKLGLIIVPTMALLMCSGLFIGFLICSILIQFGRKAQDLVYSFGYIFAPFSAIYYPVNNLPKWVINISKILPTTYVFENLRQVLTTGNSDYNLLLKSFVLNLIYLILSVSFYAIMFKNSKKRGLARLE